MATSPRERRVIGCRKVESQHLEDRRQEALSLTQWQMENETERQGGFDREVQVLELAFPPADPNRRPRGDRVRREPERDVASLHEGFVVFRPISDAMSCLVLRMDSRLHVEIVPRRQSRWPKRRRSLAEWATSAHQSPTEDELACLVFRLVANPVGRLGVLVLAAFRILHGWRLRIEEGRLRIVARSHAPPPREPGLGCRIVAAASR